MWAHVGLLAGSACLRRGLPLQPRSTMRLSTLTRGRLAPVRCSPVQLALARSVGSSEGDGPRGDERQRRGFLQHRGQRRRGVGGSAAPGRASSRSRIQIKELTPRAPRLRRRAATAATQLWRASRRHRLLQRDAFTSTARRQPACGRVQTTTWGGFDAAPTTRRFADRVAAHDGPPPTGDHPRRRQLRFYWRATTWASTSTCCALGEFEGRFNTAASPGCPSCATSRASSRHRLGGPSRSTIAS